MDLAIQMLKQFKQESSPKPQDALKPDQKLNDISKEIESDKKWRKDMEQILKDIYTSIRDDPIFRAKDNYKKKELTKSSSAWALTNSIFSDKSKSEKASPQQEPLPEITIKPEPRIIFQGVLIRKHVKEGEEKAKNRRWQKYWTKLVMDDNTLDLVLVKVSNASTDFSPTELKDIPEQETSSALTPESPSTHSPTNYKLSSSEPEQISLIHSYTLKDHKVPSRPHVFKLFTASNDVYLFETPSNYFLAQWIKHINLQAALKTKEPIRGSFGNIEYGWSDLNIVSPSDGKMALKPEDKFAPLKHRKISKWPLPPISTRLISNRLQVKYLIE